MAVYLDCNATTPVDERVQREVVHYLCEEFGNAGSRTHEYGNNAKKAVERAREQVASVVGAERDEIFFTSGATESDNIAVLGLAALGERENRRHLVSTQIEHKAVLEPLEALRARGFELTLLPPTAGGYVDADAVAEAVRADTLLVSVMHVNNETGVVQPLEDICSALDGHQAWFHVDAAQGFGKELGPLKNPRIDMMSISGHKLHAPKGVGALVARRRGFSRPPLEPLMLGGGQERGLRPGTQPVHLIAGLGLAAELAGSESGERDERCRRYKNKMLEALAPLGPVFNGDQARVLPSTVNLSFPGLDSEAVMLALKGLVAISNGSACTSASYTPSHVLAAMGASETQIAEALRWSWCYLSDEPDWEEVRRAVEVLQ